MFFPEVEFSYEKRVLNFLKPAGTSRGYLTQKDVYLIKAKLPSGFIAIGEATIIPGLSIENANDYENFIRQEVGKINILKDVNPEIYVEKHPSFAFALEMLLANMGTRVDGLYFKSDFTNSKHPLKINGLIWMGSKEDIMSQFKSKLDSGFDIIKMKVGAFDFDSELELIKEIRQEFGHNFELRLDANGAFHPEEAEDKLNKLSVFNIHSIEQPIKAGNLEEMKNLISKNIIPIALDEELIGINKKDYDGLIEFLNPHYLILKPSLLGGFSICEELIRIATQNRIGWWSTSALESNYGLAAIAQWAASMQVNLPQGLGTGSLYENNFEPLTKVEGGFIYSLVKIS